MTEQVNAIATDWWTWMLPMLWQTALLAGLIWTVDLILQRRVWPQVRYALWVLVLARLVIPPSFAMPTSLSARLLHTSGKTVATIQAPAHNPSAILPDMETIPNALTSPALPRATLSAKSWIMLGAITVSLFFLGWLLARLLRLSRLVRQAGETPPPARVTEAFADHAVRFQLRRVPRLVLTSSVQSAGVCGVFRPVVLLPESYCELSDEQLGHVFAHEFAHLKRGDLIVNAIQSLLHVVYWFNPALWLAGRRLRDLREICCDAAVSVRLRERTREYGLTLLTAAERRPQAKVELELGLLGLFENPTSLRRRIEYLAQPAWTHRRLRWILAAATAALVTLCILPMGAVKAASAADATPPAEVKKDINAQVARLNLEKAAREDVVAVFGEPARYMWGDKTFTKDALPNAYIMVYPGVLSVEMSGGQVEELRFGEGNGASDYVFGGGLRVGSSLDDAIKAMGPPDKTIEGGELGFEDGVLYKNAHFTDGTGQSSTASYYARRSKGVRIFALNDKVCALYVTRKEPPASFGAAGLPAGQPISDYMSKVAKLDLEKATREAVIVAFGDPTGYLWGGKTFTKDSLPRAYIMYYNTVFCVEIFNGQVEELRFTGKSDYVFGEGLRWGSTLEEALKVMGPPDQTVDLKGGEIGFDDGVLCRNGKGGVCYYARRSRGVRIFFEDDTVSALYVTRKGRINPWTAEQMKNKIVDRTDYPFVDDPTVHGKWVSVDFVNTIEEFRPGEKQWSASLYLTELNFLDEGKIERTFTSGIKKITDSSNTWTKGLVLSKEGGQTASAYTIKTLDGKNYLFYEWKSGDYVYGHMKPSYYVLTQASGAN